MATRTIPWQRDTITCVFSVTKTMHAAGLPDIDGPLSAADLYDWPAITSRLAAQAPKWEPGTKAAAYVMNQMLDQNEGSYRGLGIVLAAYEGLGWPDLRARVSSRSC